MNEIVEQIQKDYRKFREQCNYSFIDIGDKLKGLAEKGIVWILKDLKDISEYEEIIIDSYLNKYRANQIYDNLENHFKLHFSNQEAAPNQSSQIVTSPHYDSNNQQQYLNAKNVENFSGYKKAKKLEQSIIKVCKAFPSYERDHIVDQILRSAESIKRRIAKGEQNYIGERFNQYSIAIGSAKETSAWLQISLGQNYISKEQYHDLDNQVTEIVKILTGNLVNIKKEKGQGMYLPNPYTPNVKEFGAYNQALLLVEMIYELTRKKGFWGERHLQDDMRKNATSCVANIAEAHQLYIPVKFRFFNDALQALNALDSLLDTTLSKGIVLKERLKDIRKLRVSIRNILSKRMSNISKKKAS